MKTNNNKIFIFIMLMIILFLMRNNILTKRNNKNYHLIKYIKLCQKGILINKVKTIIIKFKITSIIAVYNSENTIKTAVRSIQNQNMKEIEILLVDDYSTDNSLKIIEELQRRDKRIKIIKNKKNRGALYSKSIAALNSKGQYIFLLDSDDLFAHINLFNICFNEVKQNNIDILEFSGFISNNKVNKYQDLRNIPLYIRFKKNNQIIEQPYLSKFIYRRKDNKIIRLIDGYLWGKCIKAEIYKKSLKIIGVKVYNKNVNYGDDRLVNYILFKIALRFKFIDVKGYIYNINNKLSITRKKNYIKNCHDELINLMNLFRFTKNTEEIEIVIYEIKFRWKWLIYPGLNKENKINLDNLLKKLLKSKYVNKINQIILNSFLKSKSKIN